MRLARAVGGRARLDHRARGRFAASQRRHCPAATGIEYTRSTSSSATPARASRHMWISSAISALILRSLSRKVSKVWMMPPSVVFSTGTTPKSASPRSTSSNTPGIVPIGVARADRPNCCLTAMCENVPSGPR